MVLPLILRGAASLAAKKLAKKAVKKVAKKAVKKAVKKTAKPKVTSQQRLERMLRSENKGDARIAGHIKKLREQEKSGLITAGERQRGLNKLTKSYKKFRSTNTGGRASSRRAKK